MPLHIFEPRYQALVKDAMARDRRIAMIQPRSEGGEDGGRNPPLFEVGCIGKVAEVEAMEDGRFNIILEGLTRFRIVRELDVTTSFRQVEAITQEFGDDAVAEPLSIAMLTIFLSDVASIICAWDSRVRVTKYLIGTPTTRLNTDMA